jgi:hypothetical protein
MSRALSMRIQDDIFLETEEIIRKNKIPRNSYINQALSFYNKLNKRSLLKKQLQHESHLVQHNSMEILNEFEKLEDNILE